MNERPITDRIAFCTIAPDGAEEAAAIESICFPPNEACKPEIMRERVKLAPEDFLTAIDRESGKMIGFINGLVTDEEKLRDEFFTIPALHNKAGKHVMILGVDVLPEYRRQGIAGAMMREYVRMEKEYGRQMLVLTCLESKIGMYEKFGYTDLGESDSEWGGEKWHEMSMKL